MRQDSKVLQFFGSLNFKIFSTILIILVASVISFIQDKLDSNGLLIGTAVLIIICFLSIAIYAGYSHSHFEEQYIDKIQILTDFIEANGMANIINEKTLAEWEEAADNIWVVTHDMSNDVLNTDSDIFHAVHNNLQRGVSYTYFVPNSRMIVGTINEYKTSAHHNVCRKGQVKVCFIEERNFNFISEIVLYDVESDKRTRGVQMFPNEMRNYYISLDEFYIVKMVGLLNDLKSINNLIEL